jgi:hypothetical protein
MSSQGPVAWLQGIMLGQRHPTYRRFIIALAVVTVGLVSAYALTVFGVVPVDASVVELLQGAAAVAVSAFVLAGLLELLVLASAYERGASEVADTGARLVDKA